MHKLIQKMKDELAIQAKNAEEKITNGNLDNIFKLTVAIKNLECMEKGSWEPVEKMAVEAADSVIKKYSNGRYDHNIDALYDAYIEAKKKYKEVGDQGHRDKLMECVGRLMTEVYDMLSSMAIDSDFIDERKEIMRHIHKLADA